MGWPGDANGNVQAIFTDALRHHQSGNLVAAERLYRQVLSSDAGHADSLHNLGVIAYQVGRNALAVELIGKAIASKGLIAAYHCTLGNALMNLGRLDEAVTCFKTATNLDRTYAEAHFNLGNALQQQRKFDEALAAYADALTHKPDQVGTHINRGVALQALGILDQASLAQRRALVLAPDSAAAQMNLGISLHKQGVFDQAAVAFGRALAENPRYAEAYFNLGNTCKELGKLNVAIAHFAQAIALKPEDALAHKHRGHALLLAGRLAEGWPEHEWRQRANESRARFAQPQWAGESLPGQTLLLHADQGIGDAIQFCRYVPFVVERAGADRGRVILEVPRDLFALLSPWTGMVDLIARGDPLPPFDLQCPLLSLPFVFGTTLETIPPPVRWPAVDSGATSSTELRVGICWQGNPAHKADNERSIPLASFSPLAQVPGVRLVSLQRQHGLDQLDRLPDGMVITTLGSTFAGGDFAVTATIINGLDLVVTVDSAVAHLAGTLGRPVWVLLAAVPDWRWMLDRDDSPWYPSVRLFRQTRRGDWTDVVDRVAAALTQRVDA